MASLGDVKIPLWINVGLAGATTVFFSIWMTLRITAWKLGVPIKDNTAQSVLNGGLIVGFLNTLASLALLYNHLLFIRFDDIPIAYIHWVIWAITFAVLGRMLSVFLAMNLPWVDSLRWMFAASSLALVISSIVHDTTRYVWFAAHAVIFIYAIHALWVYRRRSDLYALSILMLVNIVWIAGFTLPFLLGHASLRIISFTIEIWWYSAAMWIGQLAVAIFLARFLYSQGKELIEWIDHRHIKMFSTRSTDTGFPGDYLLFIPLTQDKKAQADTLERGYGKRQPSGMVVRSDLGEASRDYMESSYEVDENQSFIRSDLNGGEEQQSSKRQSPSTYHLPHLREVASSDKRQ